MSNQTRVEPASVDPALLAAREELLLLERERVLKDQLPHLYGWPWYEWALTFFESRNKMNFLCAANQISKSTTQIRKSVHWATAKELWSELWPNHRPKMFWYFYPNKDTVQSEYETKWVDILPQGAMKDDAKYGWRLEKKEGYPYAIHFASGIILYFKTYAQKSENLQSGTLAAVFCDEEMPLEHLDEVTNRLGATDGYFHMVFTATLGQDFWRRTIEPEEGDQEEYPDALKLQISLYDCLKYVDGKPSPWTPERIARRVAMCSSNAEVQRRIYGKFVIERGLIYVNFDRARHMKPRKDGFKYPRGWHLYGCADTGSGGEKNHPAGIIFLAVSPDYRQGRVFRGWRGDGIVTTAGDVAKKYYELRKDLGDEVYDLYDQSSHDYKEIAEGLGLSVNASQKSHEKGESVLNLLFKHDMLQIYSDEPELQKLAGELVTVKKETPKNKRKDDLIDPLRYIACEVPWDLSHITGEEDLAREAAAREEQEEKDLPSGEVRRRYYDGDGRREERDPVADELEEWSELY